MVLQDQSFMDNPEWWMVFVWLGVFIITLIVELCTTELVSIWFAAGSFIAMAASFAPGLPWWGELIIFFGISAICFFLMRPIFKRIMNKKTIQTNADDLVGKEIVLTKGVSKFSSGTTKINDVIWSVASSQSLKAGDPAIITQIEGNKLIVSKPTEGGTK